MSLLDVLAHMGNTRIPEAEKLGDKRLAWTTKQDCLKEPVLVPHIFSPSALEAEAVHLCESEVSLDYTVSSWPARVPKVVTKV